MGGQGFYLFLSMRLCARILELSSPRLSSLDHVLHMYERRGFIAFAGMFFYMCLFTLSCARMFDLSCSRLSSLDLLVLQTHQRRGFLALEGRQIRIQDGKW